MGTKNQQSQVYQKENNAWINTIDSKSETGSKGVKGKEE